jgi:hypothetical protein
MTVIRALVATLAIEVPIVVVCYPGQRLRLGLVAISANTLTNLTLNAVLPHIVLLHQYYLVIGEFLALTLEALAYYAAAKPHQLGRALAVSAACNALSYELGGRLLAAIAG